MAIVVASISSIIHQPGAKVVNGRTLVRLLEGNTFFTREKGVTKETRYHLAVLWSDEPPKRNAQKPVAFMVPAGSIELVSIDGPKKEKK